MPAERLRRTPPDTRRPVQRFLSESIVTIGSDRDSKVPAHGNTSNTAVFQSFVMHSDF
jgi:hypothetical protein